jgi:hypothetical protein
MGISLSPGGLIEVSAAGVLANEQIDGLFVRAVSEQNLGLEEATASDLQSLLQLVRKKIDGVSELFTLDACRHGGMTELEEAELTDGQGRALSGHKTAQAYRGYAKETMQRALAATRKRHAHLLAQKQFEQPSNGAAAVQDQTAGDGMARRNAS